MCEENSPQNKPDYKHFRQNGDQQEQESRREAKVEPEQTVEEGVVSAAEGDDKASSHQNPDGGGTSKEADELEGDKAENKGIVTDEAANKEADEGGTKKPRGRGKVWLREHRRHFLIGAAVFLGLTLLFFILYVVEGTVDQGGPLTRFGLAGATLMLMLAPIVLLVAVLLIIAVYMGKLEGGSLTKRRVLISGMVCAALIIVATVGLAQSALTCQHIETLAATCTEPETCKECGEEIGEPLGHDWEAPTCMSPKTCKRCGAVEGSPKGHTPGEWTIVEAATCSNEGKETTNCIECGDPMTQSIPKTAHTPGDMVTVQEPSVSFETGTRVDTPGKQEQRCTVCNEIIASSEIQPTEDQAAEAFRAACSQFSYDQAARDPDSLNGSLATFSGRVVQVMQEDNLYVLRVNKDNDYDCTIYVAYMAAEGAPRILEDDNITLWGTLNGLETYTTIFGASVTIPSFVALYIE